MAVVEYARHVVGLSGANSLEFDEKTPHPVVSLMESQKNVTDKGGTMRLGSYACALKPGTLAQKLYGKDSILERHRHRFEVNNQYRAKLAEAGLVFSGVNPELDLVEMVELEDHPHFIGCQFHPEFQSKPFAPHPLFSGFVRAALEARDARGR
jgi:CTP synthase